MVFINKNSNTCYEIIQNGRQRVLMFPRRECPIRGTEVFVKNVPRNMEISEILPFMQQCGLVYRIRLIMDFSGFNKGYCYVSYVTEDAAKMATLILNGYEIKPGCIPNIQLSFDNNKLLLKGIPWNITYQQLCADVLPAVNKGLRSFSWIPWIGKKKDCLLEYETHRQALEARKIIWPGVRVWNVKLIIDWTKPVRQREIKYVGFHNLPLFTTRFELCLELKKVLDIQSIMKIDVRNGKGYMAFSSENQRDIALKKLRGHILRDKISIVQNGTSAEAEFSPSYNKPTDIMIFVLPPITTEPGIYNELYAIQRFIRTFLRAKKKDPLSNWTCAVATDQVRPGSIIIKLTINQKEYGYVLVPKHYIKEEKP